MKVCFVLIHIIAGQPHRSIFLKPVSAAGVRRLSCSNLDVLDSVASCSCYLLELLFLPNFPTRPFVVQRQRDQVRMAAVYES